MIPVQEAQAVLTLLPFSDNLVLCVRLCPGMRNDGRLCSRGENLPPVPGAVCPGDEAASAGGRPGADAPLVGPGDGGRGGGGMPGPVPAAPLQIVKRLYFVSWHARVSVFQAFIGSLCFVQTGFFWFRHLHAYLLLDGMKGVSYSKFRQESLRRRCGELNGAKSRS